MKGATSSVRDSERDLCFVESILDDRSGENGWVEGGGGLNIGKIRQACVEISPPPLPLHKTIL